MGWLGDRAMVAFLKKDPDKQKGLRVREISVPLATDVVLGSGIDVMTLPEGHFACNKCHGHKFECSIILDHSRLEVGCVNCNASYRFLFPLDCPLPPHKGRFSCKKHPEKGMIIIHNMGKLCVGCESCKTQIIFDLDTKNNLILAGDMN